MAMFPLHGVEQARLPRYRRCCRERQRGPLGAQAAKVGRMIRIPAYAGDLVALGLDNDTTPHPAVGAG